jgi:hypothetical protein
MPIFRGVSGVSADTPISKTLVGDSSVLGTAMKRERREEERKKRKEG